METLRYTAGHGGIVEFKKDGLLVISMRRIFHYRGEVQSITEIELNSLFKRLSATIELWNTKNSIYFTEIDWKLNYKGKDLN